MIKAQNSNKRIKIRSKTFINSNELFKINNNINKKGDNMTSVTSRIKEIKQPRGGYLNPSSFDEIELNDGVILNNVENIPANIIGLVVDYISRMKMGDNKNDAFKISILGAKIIGKEGEADKLLNEINGIDDKSISAACKLVGYDVCFRAGIQYYKPVENINPDKDTIENIRTMIERTEKFYDEYGPVKEIGMTFEGGYTQTITVGDADFMTEDTLWDFKVSKNKPRSAQTLQLLVYYLMGMHSDKGKYSKIKNLAIYNPRLNKIFIIPINKISSETIKEVEEKVIGYRKVQQDNKTKYDEYKDYYTITELTQILKCSRHKIMQLYSVEDLPLKMVKNRYIVNKLELMEWLDEKEKERKEEKIKNVILGVVSIVLMLIIFYMLGVFLKFRFI